MTPNYEEEANIRRICKILLESQDRMIKKKDLLSFAQYNEDLFQELISKVNSRFEQIGYELIRTTFMEEIFYLLSSSGMDKNLTPQMYGILGLIFSFQKEFSRDLTMEEAKKIFTSQWEEISFLLEKGYLQEYTIKNDSYLLISPVAKVIFKDILSELSFDAILDDLKA